MTVTIQFGRDVYGNLEEAESREWLVTNGIGGYASGTIAGGVSRRYHGLLMAALQPPVGRTQLVAWMDEIVRHAGTEFALATHRWRVERSSPRDFSTLRSFVWKMQRRYGPMPSATPGWKSVFGCRRARTPRMCNTSWCREALRCRWS